MTIYLPRACIGMPAADLPAPLLPTPCNATWPLTCTRSPSLANTSARSPRLRWTGCSPSRLLTRLVATRTAPTAWARTLVVQLLSPLEVVTAR